MYLLKLTKKLFKNFAIFFTNQSCHTDRRLPPAASASAVSTTAVESDRKDRVIWIGKKIPQVSHLKTGADATKAFSKKHFDTNLAILIKIWPFLLDFGNVDSK
jgi:hypothetical protein